MVKIMCDIAICLLLGFMCLTIIFFTIALLKLMYHTFM